MPSPRRLKAFGLVVFLAVLVTLYLTSSARQTRTSEFYTKTQQAMRAAKEKAQPPPGSEESWGGETEVGKRLKEAEEAAKKSADKKGDAFHGEEGRRQASIVKDRVAAATSAPKDPKKGGPRVAKVPGLAMEEGLKKQAADNKKLEEAGAETEEDHKVKDELNSILKRSPGTLFRIPSLLPHN
jgi:hypothetical protein